MRGPSSRWPSRCRNTATGISGSRPSVSVLASEQVHLLVDVTEVVEVPAHEGHRRHRVPALDRLEDRTVILVDASPETLRCGVTTEAAADDPEHRDGDEIEERVVRRAQQDAVKLLVVGVDLGTDAGGWVEDGVAQLFQVSVGVPVGGDAGRGGDLGELTNSMSWSTVTPSAAASRVTPASR